MPVVSKDKIIEPTSPPGRVRGVWNPETVYVTGDLAHIRETDAHPDLWYECVSKSVGVYPPEDDAENPRWKPSSWANITGTLTQPDYRYQRIHTINAEMIDEYLLGKGIPAWYYFDMLGFFGTRTKLLNAIDLLTTMRGTILGVKSFLNLINLNSEITRLAPEEEYLIPKTEGGLENGEDDLSGERAWRNYMMGKYGNAAKTDFNTDIKLARFWNDYTAYRNGDHVYCNEYDGDKYTGCGLYKALANVEISKNPPGLENDDWEWVCGYRIKEFDRSGSATSSTDNSRYGLLIGQLAGRDTETLDGRIAVSDPQWQQIYTCYYKRLIDFLVPAWIRIESGMLLLDRREVIFGNNASVFSDISYVSKGFEPYTLTVYPYVGFDPNDVNYVDNCELNHTEAWRVEVAGIDENGDEFEIPEFVRWADGTFTAVNKLDAITPEVWEERTLDYRMLNPDDLLHLKAYLWRENAISTPDRLDIDREKVHGGDWAVTKIKLLSGQKVKLRSYSIYEDNAVTDWADLELPVKFGAIVKTDDGSFYRALAATEEEPSDDSVSWKRISYGASPLKPFWRWQLLNNYHNVPRFNATGRVLRESNTWQDTFPITRLR